MYSHINYEYARQYHADLLRKAEQIRLAGQVKASRNHIFYKVLALAAAAIANAQSKLFSLLLETSRLRTRHPACESC
jgi:hypothetical protein